MRRAQRPISSITRGAKGVKTKAPGPITMNSVIIAAPPALFLRAATLDALPQQNLS